MRTNRMKVHVFRTAMCGGGLSYDVLVPERECPRHVREACPGGTYHTRINRGNYENGKPMPDYLNYEDATLTAEHEAMPQGWERYESWKAHEKRARQEMLQIALLAFPELAKVAARTDSLPTLWVNGLMDNETSAMVELVIERPQLSTASPVG